MFYDILFADDDDMFICLQYITMMMICQEEEMKMFKANEDLRIAARKAGVPFWKIAEMMNVSEPTMTRKLRREMPDAEKAKILDIIEQIREQKQTATE